MKSQQFITLTEKLDVVGISPYLLSMWSSSVYAEAGWLKSDLVHVISVAVKLHHVTNCDLLFQSGVKQISLKFWNTWTICCSFFFSLFCCTLLSSSSSSRASSSLITSSSSCLRLASLALISSASASSSASVCSWSASTAFSSCSYGVTKTALSHSRGCGASSIGVGGVCLPERVSFPGLCSSAPLGWDSPWLSGAGFPSPGSPHLGASPEVGASPGRHRSRKKTK